MYLSIVIALIVRWCSVTCLFAAAFSRVSGFCREQRYLGSHSRLWFKLLFRCRRPSGDDSCPRHWFGFAHLWSLTGLQSVCDTPLIQRKHTRERAVGWAPTVVFGNWSRIVLWHVRAYARTSNAAVAGLSPNSKASSNTSGNYVFPASNLNARTNGLFAGLCRVIDLRNRAYSFLANLRIVDGSSWIDLTESQTRTP